MPRYVGHSMSIVSDGQQMEEQVCDGLYSSFSATLHGSLLVKVVENPPLRTTPDGNQEPVAGAYSQRQTSFLVEKSASGENGHDFRGRPAHIVSELPTMRDKRERGIHYLKTAREIVRPDGMIDRFLFDLAR